MRRAKKTVAPKRATTPKRAAKPRKPRAGTPMLSWSVHWTDIAGIGALFLTLPIRTVSEMNVRENRHIVTRRKQAQRAATEAVLSNVHADVRARLVLPLRMTMTRVGPRRMDFDAACISQKYVVDTIAKWLRIDDGSDDIEWCYQRVVEPAYGLRVTIETKERT